ncbi:MAG TPA: ATP-binding cassette domain-containing protein [Verrucomicrobiota bacterium]|nr:ATP-binding cassette domain-containing protein [Verrucomicrobiota bacterium]HNU51000.1 ATP-binding cassette domain-containing protein [Verrucomicrobiota bacterium]
MIQVEHLVKAFGPKLAVNDVSFTVERGEVLGFLGPNGAGKSTTMRMVTGFIPPTAGAIRIGGHDMAGESIAAKRLIGYLPENAPAYTDMTVWGFLNFAAELRGLRGMERRKAVSQAVELCFLETVLHQSVETLSKGYRHRTCFAQSIIHDPDVLVLDEPTDGLDPNQKHEVRSLIRRMGQRKAIVFSTHILEEVDAACTRAIIIDRGQIVANGTPLELRRQSDLSGAITLRLLGVAGAAAAARIQELPGVRRCAVVDEENGCVRLRVYPRGEAARDGQLGLGPSLHELAVREHWRVAELRAEEGRLDEVFRKITLPDTQRTVKEEAK